MVISFAVAAVAVYLGFWQYDRHLDRADAQADFNVAEDLQAVGLSDVVPRGTSELPDGVEWRMVSATGTFDAGRPTILRTRPIEGTPAWQYLAWLNLDSGQSLLVNLGWVPQPGPNDDPAIPDLDPMERVTISGIMRVWEPDDGKESGDTVSRIALEQLPKPTGDPVPGYAMLREWCDADGCSETFVGQQVPLPVLTLGPHLAYAWQWWVFALMAPVGAVLLLRRDARIAASTHPDADGEPRDVATSDPDDGQPVQAPTAQAPPAKVAPAAKPARASALSKRRKRELSDEEIEDAL